MQRDDEDAALDDRVRVQHMLDAAREAVGFARGKSRIDLDSSRLLARGLTHCVQEIGEAAARVIDAGRARVPDLPWEQIVGMRHILVHAYYRIDIDAVWKVVSEDLPPLITALEAALAGWSQQPEGDAS